ncbi:hypothetical protein FHG87_014739 [Trinorchestia longiramus]|nr:hypothetical protein FHG87_014739 [Trinorchestia longiramus]
MLERFIKTADCQPPPAAPSWLQMEEDLRSASPSDVIFSNMAVHAKHEADPDYPEEAIAVFQQSRKLFLATTSLEKSSQALKEHQESLAESAVSLKDLVAEVRLRAKGALLQTSAVRP